MAGSERHSTSHAMSWRSRKLIARTGVWYAYGTSHGSRGHSNCGPRWMLMSRLWRQAIRQPSSSLFGADRRTEQAPDALLGRVIHVPGDPASNDHALEKDKGPDHNILAAACVGWRGRVDTGRM